MQRPPWGRSTLTGPAPDRASYVARGSSVETATTIGRRRECSPLSALAPPTISRDKFALDLRLDERPPMREERLGGRGVSRCANSPDDRGVVTSWVPGSAAATAL